MLVIRITLLCILGITFFECNAQKIEPHEIYLIFEKNEGNYHHALGKKFINKYGLNFNLYKYYFLHSKSHNKDTLNISELDCLFITKEEEIDSLVLNFRKETYGKKPQGKHKKLYQFYDRNDIFNPYIIEILDDKIVIYEVQFRNEGIIAD